MEYRSTEAMSPLPASEIADRREAAYRAFISVTDRWLDARDIDEDDQAELLLLGLQDFIGEAMRAVYCVLTDDRSDHTTLGYLLKIPDSHPFWKQAVRTSLGLIGARVQYRPPVLLRPKRDVCSFHSCVLSKSYAAARGIASIVMSYGDWFERGSTIDDSAFAGLGYETLDILTSALHAACDAAKVEPNTISDRTLSRFQILARRIAYHRATLKARTGQLPMEFWAGTMGFVLNRIFARAVTKKNGVVVGFDHGCSSGMWDSDLQARIEFPFVHQFITFGPSMADGLRKNSSDRYCHVEFQCISPGYEIQHVAVPVWGPQIRVIYVAAAYAGHTFHSPPLYGNDCMIEWQRRLLSACKHIVPHTQIKPHPEGPLDTARMFGQELGIGVLEGWFESVDLTGVIAVFDCPDSSAFREALIRGMPIVVIDLPRLPIQAAARRALEQRVSFVPSWIDKSGRIQIRWEELAGALHKAIELAANTTAAHEFFGIKADASGISEAA